MLLNNRYRILQTLESGGCGETFLAEDTHMPSRRRCVIKQLKPATDEPFAYDIIKERFQFEAATLETIGRASDQIPHLYAYFTENREFYLVQDFIEGKNLKRKVLEEGLFNEYDARKFLVSLLGVLNYVHSQGIIHRDVKPENVMIRASDSVPVLIDFGAVKEVVTMVSTEGTLNKSIVIGSPGYMPPEQAMGFPVFASDLYSLGKTTIFALTGKTPRELDQLEHKGTHWTSFAPQVSPELAAVLDKATRPADSDRYLNAQEMLQALELDKTIVSHSEILPETWVMNQRPLVEKRSSTLKYIVIAILSIGLVVVVISALYNHKEWVKAEGQLAQERNTRQAYEARLKETETKLRATEDRANKAETALASEKSKPPGDIYHLIQIGNHTKNEVTYSVLNPDGTWWTGSIKPGETNQHRRNMSITIRFDSSFASGYQEKKYTLTATVISGHTPTSAEENAAELHYFALDLSGDIDLYPGNSTARP